jgi:hypothetical protein
MAPLLVGAIVAGTALNAYGKFMEGQAQAKSLLEQADLLEVQSLELQRRSEYNITNQRSEMVQHFGSIATSSVASGVGIGEGTLDTMRQEAINTSKNVAEQIRETNYQRKILARQAKAAREQADSAETAGYLGAAGSLLSFAGSPAGMKIFG